MRLKAAIDCRKKKTFFNQFPKSRNATRDSSNKGRPQKNFNQNSCPMIIKMQGKIWSEKRTLSIQTLNQSTKNPFADSKTDTENAIQAKKDGIKLQEPLSRERMNNKRRNWEEKRREWRRSERVVDAFRAKTGSDVIIKTVWTANLPPRSSLRHYFACLNLQGRKKTLRLSESCWINLLILFIYLYE